MYTGEVSRKIWLHDFAINNNGGSVPVIFISLIEAHPELKIQDANPSDIMDSEGYYRCRSRCGLVYKTKATRNK